LEIEKYQKIRSKNEWAWYGWLGMGLVLIFWYLNWNLVGLRTHWGFFPLWLGYILIIDSLVKYRTGTSPIQRNNLGFLSLFLVSVPCWWLFEILNEKAHYWVYTGRSHFTDLEYFLWASISFSTVIPAVFETSELVSSWRWIRRSKFRLKISHRGKTPFLFFIIGWILLGTFVIWPAYGAAFLWMSLYLILDPINIWLGNRSILQYTAQREWRPVWALCIGCLTCGFFWEMWNFHSDPKWFYQVPGVDFWYVFEMPLLGYLGYLPFSLELFAVYHFVVGVLAGGRLGDYIRLGDS